MSVVDRSKKFQMDTERTINGTFGEVWIDSDYMAEVTALQANVEMKTSDVNQCGTLVAGTKTTGLECKGNLKLNKCTSYFQIKMSDNLKKGKATTFDIIAKVDDPAAYGAERVKLIGCKFSKLTLIDFEANKLMEESHEFTFSDWQFLDTIK